LRTQRLALEPLRIAHAVEMVALLADRGLYEFYDDEASPTLEELTARYERQVRGQSPDGTQDWHNWILRETLSGNAVGFVQATVGQGDVELAWVVGTAHQGRGYAVEATTAVRDAFLSGRLGVSTNVVVAHIAPGNLASEAVARRLGLAPTDLTNDGETRWQLEIGPDGLSD
jgi:RimJ/RimL family protein N-acetyltransferase